MDASFLKSQHPVVEELLTNKYFGDTLLICSNGHLTDNKLAVGLLFPCLRTSDVFSLPIENVLLVPDYTMEEIGGEFEKLIIGQTFKETYEAALRAKAVEAERNEEESELAKDITDTANSDCNPSFVVASLQCPGEDNDTGAGTSTAAVNMAADIEEAELVIDESVIENMSEGDFLMIGNSGIDGSVTVENGFQFINCENVQIGKTSSDNIELILSDETLVDKQYAPLVNSEELTELGNFLEVVAEKQTHDQFTGDTDGNTAPVIPVLRPEKPITTKKSVTFKEPLDPPKLVPEVALKRIKVGKSGIPSPSTYGGGSSDSDSSPTSRTGRRKLKLKTEDSPGIIYIENIPGLPSDNEETDDEKESKEKQVKNKEDVKKKDEDNKETVLENRKPGRPRTRSDNSPVKNEDGLTKFKVKSAEWVSKGVFKCDICKRVLSCLGSLERHKRIHFDDKPYKCKFCSKSFRESGKAQVHERVHTGSKPFQCQQCEKTFRTSTQRIIHMRTHTKEKPFTCKFCGKLFGQSYSVTVHINKFHKKKDPTVTP